MPCLCLVFLLLVFSALLCTHVSAEDGHRWRGSAAPPGVSKAAFKLGSHRLQPDMFESLPREFEATYKTPCWHAADAKLHCLPYFYIAGVFQSGVIDLFERLKLHPEVAPSHMKHWWDGGLSPYKDFDDHLASSVPFIEANPGKAVLGDPSFSTFTYTWSSSERVTREWATAFAHCRKETCKTEQPCVERTCYTAAADVAHPLSGGGVNMTIPWMVRAAHGTHAKIIVLLRDPIERFHAAFWSYEHYRNKYGKMATGKDADEASFSAYANEMVDNLERCLSEGYTERECMEAFEALTPRNEQVFYHMDQLLKSIHVHWMEGWMQAFPREAFLVLRLEDWKHSKTGLRDMLLQVIAFLQLTPVDASTLEKMVALPKRTFTGRATYIEGRGRIEPATRARLRAFFDPYNRRLANLLNDDKWLWQDTEAS